MIEEPYFIGDWYREKKLGSGGFGVVNLWVNKKTQQQIAIKKCHVLLGDNEVTKKQKERWDREIHYMTEVVKNDYIVKTIKVKPDTFLQELNKYNLSRMQLLIMEYCDEGDLRKVLNKNISSYGLPESEVRSILTALSSAISYLHRLQITHRDIKPENIVIKTGEGERKIYKLTDLGYAKPLDRKSIEASLVGTMEYLAPELLFVEKYSCSVDYWSLGIIAYEIITGQRPFIPHMPLAKWMLLVKEKKSIHISIVEDNEGEINYVSQLSEENNLSSVFLAYLEKWLKLPLDYDPKHRGCIFELPPGPAPAQVTNNHEPQLNGTQIEPAIVKGPQQTLQIFTMLNNFLNRKILTFFCLYSYKFLSYDITTNSTNSSANTDVIVTTTTMDDIYEFIERKCNIPKDKIYLIISLRNENVTNMTDRTKPIDLYISDFYEEPMIYISRIDSIMDSKCMDIPSNSIQYVFKSPRKKLKIHYLKQFAYNAFYYIRKAQHKYVTSLNGYHNYALQINHNIDLEKKNIQKMCKLIYSLEGARQLCNLTIDANYETLEKLECPYTADEKELWQNNCLHIKKKILSVTDACDKIVKRYESALRRSNETLKHKLFENIQKDYFDLVNLSKAFDTVRAQIMNKSIPENPQAELVQCVYKCFKQRDRLLMESGFKELQKTISNVHIEIDEIIKTVEKAVVQAEKYHKDIVRLFLEHKNSIWNSIEIGLKNKKPQVSMITSTTTSMAEETTIPTTKPSPTIMTMDASTSTSTPPSTPSIPYQLSLIPDIDKILGTNNSNITEPVVSEDPPEYVHGILKPTFRIGSNISEELREKYGDSVLCFGEGEDVQSLMNDNEKLRISMEGLLRDIATDLGDDDP